MASLDSYDNFRPKNKPSSSKKTTTLLIVDVDKTESISVNTRLLNSFKPIVIATAVALMSCVALIIILIGLSVNKSIQVNRASHAETEAQQAAMQLQNEVIQLQTQSSKEIEAKLEVLESTEKTINVLQSYLKERGVNPPAVASLNRSKTQSNNQSNEHTDNLSNVQSKDTVEHGEYNQSYESSANNQHSVFQFDLYQTDLYQTDLYQTDLAHDFRNNDFKNHQGGPVTLDVSYMAEYGQQIEVLNQVVRQVPIGLPHTGALSSRFGKRTNPFGGQSTESHHGLDFKGVTGQPIKSTADGIVVTAGRAGGYGLAVKIKHGYGYLTVFGHLSAVDVEVGQKVKAGDIIGKLGSTGRSTGPHLHYEVRKGGQFLNPESFISLNAPPPNYKTL